MIEIVPQGGGSLSPFHLETKKVKIGCRGEILHAGTVYFTIFGAHNFWSSYLNIILKKLFELLEYIFLSKKYCHKEAMT